MKVRRLWVKEYRVLQDLNLVFSAGRPEPPRVRSTRYALDLLVGVNGTGKSTVLRALVEIFRRLDGNKNAASFGFEIEYSFKAGEETRSVFVKNYDRDADQPFDELRIKYDGGDFAIAGDIDDAYRPPFVIAYTTGYETAWLPSAPPPEQIAYEVWERAIETSDRWIRELPGGSGNGDNAIAPASQERVQIVRSWHLPYVTLCGLLFEQAKSSSDERVLDDVYIESGLSRLSGFSLRFRLNKGVVDREDEERIRSLSLKANRARKLGSDVLYVFDVASNSKEAFDRLCTGLECKDALELYQELIRLSTPQGNEEPVLQHIELFLERRVPASKGEQPGLHTLGWLSDGERTFLGRMCLLSLFGAQDALILLDEPEVHFNDFWKRQIIRLLDHTLRGHDSHAIISTHSSVVLTDASPRQILILDRQGNHTTRFLTPRIQTYATDPSDIMLHVFGAEQSAGARSVEHIRAVLNNFEATRLGSDDETRSIYEEQKQELQDLRDTLGPGYWHFRVLDALNTAGGDDTSG